MVSSCESSIVSRATQRNEKNLPQVGVLYYPRLRMEGLSGPYPLPVDDMGPWLSALCFDILSYWHLDSFVRLIGLLHHARGWTCGRDNFLCWHGCYEADKLSGGWYVALAYTPVFTSCGLKAWLSLLLVSFRSGAHPRVRMPDTRLISDFFVPVFGCCFVIDRSSHVCSAELSLYHHLPTSGAN